MFAFKAPNSAKQLTVTDVRREFVKEMVSFASTAKTDGTWVSYIPVQPENSEAAERYYALLIEEFAKYPIAFIKASKLKKIVLVEQLMNDTLRVAAVPKADTEVLYYDVTYIKDVIYSKYVIHHEYYHMLEDEWNGSYYYKDPKWAALNPKGFKYGSGGSAAYSAGNTWGFVSPFRGFIDKYSTFGLEEDKAEVWSVLFVPEIWKQVKPMTRTDSIIAAKVDYMRKFGTSKCAEMDDAYWKKVSGEID